VISFVFLTDAATIAVTSRNPNAKGIFHEDAGEGGCPSLPPYILEKKNGSHVEDVGGERETCPTPRGTSVHVFFFMCVCVCACACVLLLVFALFHLPSLCAGRSTARKAMSLLVSADRRFLSHCVLAFREASRAEEKKKREAKQQQQNKSVKPFVWCCYFFSVKSCRHLTPSSAAVPRCVADQPAQHTVAGPLLHLAELPFPSLLSNCFFALCVCACVCGVVRHLT
jgi:hypothetical protein